MFSSHTPIILIACLIGLAFIAGIICVSFCVFRHRDYLAKAHDAEASHLDLPGMDMAQGRLPYPDGSGPHPPGYDNLGLPPPSYQAVFTRNAAPTEDEVQLLRRRLEKLCRRRSMATPDHAAREGSIRDSEVRRLTQWIERLETLREDEEAVVAGTGPLLLDRRRRTMRLVSSQSEPASLPTRSTVILREQRWSDILYGMVPRARRPSTCTRLRRPASPDISASASSLTMPTGPTRPVIPPLPFSPTLSDAINIRLVALREQALWETTDGYNIGVAK